MHRSEQSERFQRTRVVSLGLSSRGPIERPRREVGGVHRGDGLRDALGLRPHLVEHHSLLRLALVTIVPNVLGPLRKRVHADNDGAALRGVGGFVDMEGCESEPTCGRPSPKVVGKICQQSSIRTWRAPGAVHATLRDAKEA